MSDDLFYKLLFVERSLKAPNCQGDHQKEKDKKKKYKPFVLRARLESIY
jgi:hypothetical protein